MFKKLWKKVKSFFKKVATKKNINNTGWIIYHKCRKKNYKEKFKNQKDVKLVPFGALGSVFGSNKLTELYQEVISGLKETPTHSMMYIGGGNHKIVEADIYYSFNQLEKYANKKVVFHWFKNLNYNEIQKIKERVYYLISKKLFYDIKGYSGFLIRKTPFLKKLKWLMASNTTVFCSESNITIYHGDEKNTDEKIRNWNLIRKISKIFEANKVTPVHIYIFMEDLYKKFPGNIGRLILYPKI